MTKTPSWQVRSRREHFAARPYVVVTQEGITTETGQKIEDFYRVDLAPFSVCVPQLEDGGIVTLWQYKHGPRQFGLTFPAGYLDDGEDAETACRRELREETGLEGADWRHLGEFVDHGNQRGSVGNYFVASGCRFVTQADAGDLESMELRVMRPAQIDAALADGSIHIVHHVAAWCLARPHLLPG